MRTRLFERRKLTVNIGSRAEVESPDKVIEAIVEKIRRPVALKESNLRAEMPAQHIANPTHIPLVSAV